MSLNIGVISLAHVHADRYLQILANSPDVSFKGIWHDNTVLGAETAARYGTSFHASLSELLSVGLDGVIICSENAMHREHCIAALESGSGVLCEKPLATTREDAQAIGRAVEASGRPLKVAFTTRFGEAARTCRELLKTGGIGKVLSVVGTNHGRNPGGWFVMPELSGGGAMIDHIVHQLDYVRWATGSEPISVFAEKGRFFSNITCEDAGLIVIKFSDGMTMTIDASWSRPAGFPTWGDNIMEFNGSSSTAYLDTQARRVLRYGTEFPGTRYSNWGGDDPAAMLGDFFAALQGKPSTGSEWRDGLAAVRTVLAAYRSAESGKVEKI